MQFSLKKGMIDNDIYSILQNNISGETTQQVVDFFSVKDLDHKDKPIPLHEVIIDNGQYAVIERKRSLFCEYGRFLTGINDEGKYFVKQLLHPFSGMPRNDLVIDNIIKEINMEDTGFERIQGDILVKTINITDLDSIKRTEEKPKFIGFGRFKKLVSYEKIESLYPTMFTCQVEPAKNNWFELVDSDGVIMPSVFSNPTPTQEMNTNMIFRNHKIDVINGRSYANYGKRVIIAIGEKVILTHNEHARVELQIPKCKALLFIQQQSSRSD